MIMSSAGTRDRGTALFKLPVPTFQFSLGFFGALAMGKQKQLVISRFFSPKTTETPSPARSPEKSAGQVISRFFDSGRSDRSPSKLPSTPPKVSAVVSFSSASKRALQQRLDKSNSLSAPPEKKRKLESPSDSSLHQKFVKKLLDSHDQSPALISSGNDPKFTPLEQQVVDLKSRYPDVLLLVEVGYRYRFFGEDAAIAAKVLGIFCHMDHNFLTASIPTFRLNFHLRRLVSAGHKVGVVKQQETAAIKAHGSNRLGPFSRGLSALYTKSTIEAAEDTGGLEEGLTESISNYLLCLVERSVSTDKGCGVEGSFDVRIGIVAVEISTGDVIHGEFNDNIMRSGLEAVLLSLSPVELLLGEPITAPTEKLLLGYAGTGSEVRIERASRDCFNDGGALAEVMSLCDDKSGVNSADLQENTDGNRKGGNLAEVEGIFSMSELAVQALALTIRYLKRFGFERVIHLGASFRPLRSNFEMCLSANTLSQLEVLKNKFNGSMEGTLLNAMNLTHTSFGLRLLKYWVSHPLCDKTSILARLDAVSEIVDSMSSSIINSGTHPSQINQLLASVLTTLGRSPDLQRGISRIFYRTATPSEFITTMHAIVLAGKELQGLHLEDDGRNLETNENIVHSGLLRRLIVTASSSSLISRATNLLSCLNKDAAERGDKLHLFELSRDEFPDIMASQAACRLAEERLDSLITQYRKQLGMRNLEFTSVSGTTHLIELPVEKKVPADWVRVSSTKKSNRYHPPEVLGGLDDLMLAKEEFAVSCKAAWTHFLADFGKYYAEFQAAVQALAALDCLYSLATLAKKPNFVRPVFVEDDEPNQIHIVSGRHPVLESVLGENFVPNDTNLRSDGEFCQIVTGPNMGGKSCYIRQVALISIMAQVGSFVPASSAKFHVMDGIYTRMGASDSILQGRSTFLEELSEASHVLDRCSSRSLVIIDELGRGTSTHDGFAIAYAALHHLLHLKKPMTLFVTHYPKITQLQREFPSSLGTFHVSYLTHPLTPADDPPDVTFLYKLARGASDKSFGLNVARLAQLPRGCLERASVMAGKIERKMTRRRLSSDVDSSGLRGFENLLRRFFQLLESGSFEAARELAAAG
ncbi:homolog of DNA mismatch repair protein MSH3 isoform X2 [Wolffia australiana]